MKERALAILRLYDGATEEETAKSVARCEKSVRNWLKRWNERGVRRPRARVRRRPEAEDGSGEWDKIVQEIEGKGMTLKDVEVYVKDTRGVHYAYKTVWKVLRKEKKVRYGKAYKMNAKRPPDAEGILKKR